MRGKPTGLVLLNAISFIAVLVVNYVTATQVLNGITVGDVSHKYDTLFAPADYAFVIWSVIYLLCAGFVIYQWILLKDDPKQYIKRTGIWFTAGNIANALWCYCWVHEWLGWCVILIIFQLITLIILTIKLRLELDDEPVCTIFFVWWPISFYLGWLIVATVACIASWLVFLGWAGAGISPDVWTVIMIILAFVVYLFFNQTRNLRETSTVGIWAFIAIAVRQWNIHKDISITAAIAIIILSALIGVHASKNKETTPFAKIARGEWK